MVADAALTAVVASFPEAAAKIRRLFQDHPSFRSLCQDYRDCQAAWQHWRQAETEDASFLSQSYADLLEELKEEVRRYLEKEEEP